MLILSKLNRLSTSKTNRNTTSKSDQKNVKIVDFWSRIVSDECSVPFLGFFLTLFQYTFSLIKLSINKAFGLWIKKNQSAILSCFYCDLMDRLLIGWFNRIKLKFHRNKTQNLGNKCLLSKSYEEIANFYKCIFGNVLASSVWYSEVVVVLGGNEKKT